MPATWMSCFESDLWAEFHDTDNNGDTIVASNIPAHESSCVMHLHYCTCTVCITVIDAGEYNISVHKS